MITVVKGREWEDFGKRMEYDARGNSKMLYRALRNMKQEPLRKCKI